MKQKLVLILLLMLILPGLNGFIAMGPITGNVTSFNDSDTYKVVDLNKNQPGTLAGYIEIPNRAVITNAAFNVTVTPDSNYEYPKDIYVDVGDDGKYEWAFSGDGYGQLGQQQKFLSNSSDARLKISGDSYNRTASIRLPKNATVTSTHMLIDGRANVSGADPSDSWTPSMKSWQSCKVAANISGGKVFYARYNQRYYDIYDPTTNTWSTSSLCTDFFNEPSHGITVVGTEIFSLMRSSSWTYGMWSYGTNNNTWTFLKTLPTSSQWPDNGGLTYDHGDKVYLLSYWWTSSSSIDFFEYSISKSTWTKRASPPNNQPNYPTLCYLKDRVYMYNYTWSGGGNNFYFYAPNNNSWFKLVSAPIGIISKLCTDGYNIFGATAQGQILKYDIGSNTWDITGKKISNFITAVAGLAYSDRTFYLGRYNPSAGYFKISGLAGGDFPVNASLNIGDNGLPYEWNITGEFNTTDYVNDFSAELNSLISSTSTTYTDAYGNEFVDIPINVTSNVSSEFSIRRMYINYSYTEQVDINPTTGNLINSLNELVPSTFEGNIKLPIIIYTSIDGRVNITDILIDYYIPDLTNDRLEVVSGTGWEQRTIYTDLMYYTFLVNVTNLEGYTDVNNVTLHLAVDTEDIQLLWTEATNSFLELRDPKDLVNLDESGSNSLNDAKGNWTLNFKVLFNWTYANETPELCALNTTNDSNAWKFDLFHDVYRVENDLDLIGTLDVIAADEGVLVEDGANNWVHAAETITWSNLTVVYEDTINIYPANKNFNITITDDDSGKWMNMSSSGGPFIIKTVSDPTSDYNDLHNIEITEIPGLGEDVSDWTFLIKTDDDGPLAPVNIVCHADSTVDQQTAADNDETIYVVWGVASDGTGSGVVEYAMEYNNPLPTAIKTSGIPAIGEEGLATFYVRARDKVGNWGVTGSDSIFIDLTLLTYTDPTPASEDWQNNRTVAFGIKVNDIGGSGIDYDEVQYRKVDFGGIENGSWNKYTGPGTSGETITCQQNITFAYDGIDKKIQWRAKDIAENGWVESDIYQIKIDSTPVTIDYKEPNLNKWLDTKTPTFKLYLNDTDGSGVDLSTLAYSISTTGLTSFGPWQSLTGQVSGSSVYCILSPTFIEGDQNYIQFKATDNAGNELTFDPQRIKIDVSDIEFLDPVPSLDSWIKDESLQCKVIVRDTISSIDTSTIRYQYSINGTTKYSHWKLASEIKALPDGKSFEISADIIFKEGSNNYLHWSAVDLAGHPGISDDYQINIDLSPIKFGETIMVPTKDDWINTLAVPCSISIDDISGSGVKADTIEYSISTGGLKEFGDWTSTDIEISDLTGVVGSPTSTLNFVSERVSVTVTPHFEEGTNNYIRWQGTDLASNSLVISEPQQVNIDLQPVSFINPIPSENQISEELEQLCKITVKDLGGSEVRKDTVEYRYTTTGKTGFSGWSNEQLNQEGKNTFFVYVQFKEGTDNFIQWRANDNAGNGPTESKIYNITINSPPTAVIDKPIHKQQFEPNEKIIFDASSSVDQDTTDVLTYQWKSNISMVFGETKTLSYQLPSGVHLITLSVNDGQGHIVSTEIEIIVTKYIPPSSDGDDPDGGDEPADGGDVNEPSAESKDYTIIYVLIIVMIIVMILVAIAVTRKRKQVRENLARETEELTSKMQVSAKASSALQTTPMQDASYSLSPAGPGVGMPMMMPQLPPAPGFGENVPQHMVNLSSQIQGITPVQSYIPQPTVPPTEPTSSVQPQVQQQPPTQAPVQPTTPRITPPGEMPGQHVEQPLQTPSQPKPPETQAPSQPEPTQTQPKAQTQAPSQPERTETPSQIQEQATSQSPEQSTPTPEKTDEQTESDDNNLNTEH